MKTYLKNFAFLIGLLIPAIVIAALPTRIENGVIVDPYIYPKNNGNLLGNSTYMWDAWLRKLNGYTLTPPLLDSSLSTAHIYLGDGNSVAQKVAPTGDVTINATGVTAISSGVIVNDDVNASAGITYPKLDLAGSIVNADIATGASIARSKTAPGNAYRILANDVSGVMSENAALTAAGVCYADANGQLANDPTNLYWDAVNKRLGIGVAASENTLTVNGVTYGSTLSIHAEGATDIAEAAVHRHSATAAFGAHLGMARSRGSEASETIVQSGDYLSRFDFLGFDGTDYEIAAEISAEVDGTPGNNDMPGRLVFRVAPDGSSTVAEAMRISQDKAVTMAGTLGVTGQITGNLTGDVTGTASGNALVTRAINTTAPLQGGGDLSADRTLTIDAASSTASGVVNISDQEFAGLKDFQKLALGQSTVSTTGNIDALDAAVKSSFRLTGAAPVLRGIANGANGRIITVVNATGAAFNVLNQDTTPTAANRIITGTGADLELADTASIILQYDATTQRWRVVGGSGGGGGTGTSLVSEIAQTTHGFAVGDVLYYTGSTWAKAKADADSTSEVLGVVSTVPTANDFTLVTNGEISGLTGLTGGSTYYLSGATAGALTVTEPTTVGYISKPVLVAGSSTAGYVIHSRGQVVTAAAGTSNPRNQLSRSDANGLGSTNTGVLKWGTSQEDTGDLSYSETAANGGHVLIATSGIYSIDMSYGDGFSTTSIGIAVDVTGSTLSNGGATLAGNIRTLGWADGRRAAGIANTANAFSHVHWEGYLAAGAKIYFMSNGGVAGATNSQFTVTQTGY